MKKTEQSGDRAGAVVRCFQAAGAGVLLLMAACFLVSCTTVGMYSIEPGYLPSPAVLEERPGEGIGPVTVALFSDGRKVDDEKLVGRVIERNRRSVPVLPRHAMPSRLVTKAMSTYLTSAGFSVAPRHPAWDLQEETLDPSWGTIVLGGTIQEFFIECDRSSPLNVCSAEVGLTILLADARTGRIFHQVTVTTAPTRQHVRFSDLRMEEELSSALSEALERAFADSALIETMAGRSGGR